MYLNEFKEAHVDIDIYVSRLCEWCTIHCALCSRIQSLGTKACMQPVDIMTTERHY